MSQQSGKVVGTHEFTPLEQELEPQPSGSRFGPPRKRTAADLLDQPQFPSTRARCFGCSRVLTLREIGPHVRVCDKVSSEDWTRFKTALIAFEIDPGRARVILEQFVNRTRRNCGFDAAGPPL